MSTERTNATALAPALWPTASPALRAVILVALGIGLLTLSAKVQVPFWPVPMTLTTFAVMAIAAAYGSRLAVATVIAYILTGMAGVPVFAGAGAGPAYLVGTTAGFIWGYIPCAFLIGLAADRGLDRSPLTLGLAMLIGDAIIFILGFAWLAFFAQLASGGTGIGVAAAWKNGVEPFLLGDALKIALAACLIPAGWALLRRRDR
ncbi:MAG: biotin transporter BioY [Bauldia sp.]|nr:biotin transporter BioY [Bauldia sp.]